MAIVVGLDLSLTSAGIAILADGQPKLITHVGHKGRDGDDWRNRSRRVRSQCGAIMGAIWTWRGRSFGERRDGIRDDVDLAVIEGPLIHGPQQAYEFDRAALWHGVYGALEAWRVPIAVINPMTLKLWWTGDGTASKLRMLDTARARFRPAISTHDEADAVALACGGAHWLGDPVPFEPNQRQLDAVAKVDWPVRAA